MPRPRDKVDSMYSPLGKLSTIKVIFALITTTLYTAPAHARTWVYKSVNHSDYTRQEITSEDRACSARIEENYRSHPAMNPKRQLSLTWLGRRGGERMFMYSIDGVSDHEVVYLIGRSCRIRDKLIYSPNG